MAKSTRGVRLKTPDARSLGHGDGIARPGEPGLAPALRPSLTVTGLIVLYPNLESQLIGPDGDLNRFVNAFLNDTDVRHLEALDTPVGDGDTLVLLPAMAGGR